MDDMVTITVPRYAARWLAAWLMTIRSQMARRTPEPGTFLENEADFDSLDQVESAIPDDVWKELHG